MTTTATVDTATANTIRSDWVNACWREKFGNSLLTEDEKRLLEYRDMDIGHVNVQALRLLDKVDVEKKDVRNVAQSFTPAAGLDLRLRAPIRA